MALITYPDKITGDQFTGVNATEVKDVVNTNDGLVTANTSSIVTNVTDISARLPLAGGTMTVSILGNQLIQGFRGTGTTVVASNNLIAACTAPNAFYKVDSSSGAIVITIGDADVPNASGWEYEFFVDNLDNDISFAVSGAQTIKSLDGNLKLDGLYSAAILKYIATNEWALIGSLKA